jgi:hypothetical protein
VLALIIRLTWFIGFPWMWTFPIRVRGDPPRLSLRVKSNAITPGRPATTAETWTL